jgi:hypothetical protein
MWMAIVLPQINLPKLNISFNTTSTLLFFALLRLHLTTEAKNRAGLRGTFLSPGQENRAAYSNSNPTETRMGRSLC